METKNTIMNTTFKLFAAKGSEFSLNEVANEVGIQKPSIYAHFASKEELLYTVINKEINSYFLKINENCTDLKSMFFMILNYYEETRTKLFFWKRLLFFPPQLFEETLNVEIQKQSQQRFELIKKMIESSMENGTIRRQDPEAVAYSFLSLIHGVLSSSIIYKSDSLAKHYENIWEIFLNGVK